ncbi:MAG: hypothetical protein CL874_01330 [Dehalococcoidales bacterium]|nr:hypothetical protein [Dehalococcoidales bacterium]|tara:strand:- start:1333 stop:2316 length:984 start_codon:yes stop_codon:yes gene_type:complete
MSCTVTQESFDSLALYLTGSNHHLKWGSIFVLPPWLAVWWREFHPRTELYLSVARQGKEIIGIAPLQIKEKEAGFIGSTDVCDYLDFIVSPGSEAAFFNVLFDDLGRKGISCLDLNSLRPDATALTHLGAIAQERGYEVHCREEAVSLEVDLPVTWEEYLALLTKKQRHEVRRKMRRLDEANDVAYRCVSVNEKEVGGYMNEFLRLFTLGHEVKANFMTVRMKSFFRALAKAMAEIGRLRFGILELNTLPVAMTMSFEDDGVLYLYNSAYEPKYNSLSVGVLSKVFGIKESIERGIKRWDFLRGAEAYKYQLGGREVRLSSCRIVIK